LIIQLYSEPLKLLNFDFNNADPDTVFHSNADPDQAAKNNADPNGTQIRNPDFKKGAKIKK
jgi:hypothetical protein